MRIFNQQSLTQSRLVRTLLLGSTCFAAPSLIHAEVAAPPPPAAEQPSANVVQDIIVTATRREDRLQNVPIAVTALSARQLEQKQITDVVSLVSVVPGMSTRPTLSALETVFALRGVAMYRPEISIDPPIGIYVDGVYNAISAGSNSAMVDMARAEVLKGPQGILFGRNTIGGAISITTNKPTDEFGGYVQADVGNYGAIGGTVVVNTPIKPGMLDARFVYQHVQHGGFGRNFTTNTPTGTLNQDYVRGTIKFNPTPDWELQLMAFYTAANGYSAPTKLTYINAAGPLNATLPFLGGKPGDLLSNYIGNTGFQDTFSNFASSYSLEQYGATGSIVGHLSDAVTIKSITAYTHTDYNQRSDLDGTPYTIISLLDYPIHVNQFSEELQFYGDVFDDRLTWIGGGYFFSSNGSQIGFNSVLPAFSGGTISTFGPTIDNKSYAAFGQITYEVVPKVRLTAGVRYVHDDRHVSYSAQLLNSGRNFFACALASAANPTTGAFGTDLASCHFERSASFSYVPWTAGVDYRPNNDMLLYAKISQGYRSGAFGLQAPAATGVSATVTAANAVAANAAALAAFGPVQPERLLSPEIGGKFEFFGRRLRVNVAAYYSKYSNIQLNVNLPPACGACSSVVKLENSGTADIWGGEIEATALIGKLELDAGLGYTDPKYVAGVRRGERVLNVSKYSASITATYPFEFEAGTLTVSGTYSYLSGQMMGVNAVSCGVPGNSAATCVPNSRSVVDAAISQPGYGLFNARIAFQAKDYPVTLALYAKNLANEKYRVQVGAFGGLNYANAFPGPPMTVGGSIKLAF